MHRTPMSWRSLFIAASALVALGLLVACSSATNGGADAVPSYDVTVSDPDGSQPVALGQAMMNGEALSPVSLSPSAWTPISGGLWIGNSVDAGANDTVTVTLPAASELPPEVLTRAENAFLNATSAADCSVDATPGGVQVSYTSYLTFLSLPGLVAFTSDGFNPVVLSDSEIDVDATDPLSDGTRLYTWIHADGATEVRFTGSDCGAYDADLGLEAGWNTAAWVVGNGGSTFTLRDVVAPQRLTATAFAP